MEQLIFHICKGGKRFPLNGGYLTCKGYGDFSDIINLCGEDLLLENGKYYTEGGHLAGYADGDTIDLDGKYDTWYVKDADRLTYAECQAATEAGYEGYDPDTYDCIDVWHGTQSVEDYEKEQHNY